MDDTFDDIFMPPSRAAWAATIVGQLEASWGLTPEEQYTCLSIVNKLLHFLNIPDRSDPATLPIVVYQELTSGFWTKLLRSIDENHFTMVNTYLSKTPTKDDIPVDVWLAALSEQIETAYPDLSIEEKIIMNKVLLDLLIAIKAHERKLKTVPVDVARLAQLR